MLPKTTCLQPENLTRAYNSIVCLKLLYHPSVMSDQILAPSLITSPLQSQSPSLVAYIHGRRVMHSPQ